MSKRSLSEADLRLEVSIGSLWLQHPAMPASGAFGEEMDEVIDFNELAAIVPKSITKESRQGNKTPRVCETPAGMINSIGIHRLDYASRRRHFAAEGKACHSFLQRRPWLAKQHVFGEGGRRVGPKMVSGNQAGDERSGFVNTDPLFMLLQTEGERR